MRGQRQEPRLLLRQHVGDGPMALFGMRPLMRDLVTPAPKLGVQILEIGKRARRKEGVATYWIWRSTLPFVDCG
jgi:hypothetical protein